MCVCALSFLLSSFYIYIHGEEAALLHGEKDLRKGPRAQVKRGKFYQKRCHPLPAFYASVFARQQNEILKCKANTILYDLVISYQRFVLSLTNESGNAIIIAKVMPFSLMQSKCMRDELYSPYFDIFGNMPIFPSYFLRESTYFL